MKKKTKLIITAIIFFIFMIPFFYFVVVYQQNLKKITEEFQLKSILPTVLYDRNGEVIAHLYEEMRMPVRIEEVPDVVKKAFIAAEDRSFYSHSGLDFISICRAMIVNISTGSIKQGGSTITQQIVKQFYTKREKTFERKVLEVLLVQKIEEKFAKDKILEMYLNQIYFGHGVYGIKSAARFYFDSELSDLNIFQASMLAIIPPAPNKYSPLKNPILSYERHKVVMNSLIDEGYISKEEAAENFDNFWKSYLSDINNRSPQEIVRTSTNSRDKAPYFTEYIRKILINKYGSDEIYKGGKKVYTTLDLRMQEIADRFINEKLDDQNIKATDYNNWKIKRIEEIVIEKANPSIDKKEEEDVIKFMNFYRDNFLEESELISLSVDSEKTYRINDINMNQYESLIKAAEVQGALVALIPGNGHIIAMVGGSGFNYRNQFNHVTQARRQPGSAFKTFVYAAGIDKKKITAGSPFLDLPLVFGNGSGKKNKKSTWSPKNANNKYIGKVLLRTAFAKSINTVAVLSYEDIGGKRISTVAANMMNIPVERFTIDPTLALGSSEITPMEIARGYSVIANQGKDVTPIGIIKITDSNDNIIYEEKSEENKKQIISKETSFIMTSMLKSVVEKGTATRGVKIEAGYTKPAAGKTGTNKDSRDAWFVGFIPGLSCAVWIGCDSQEFSLGYNQYGSNVAAPVWGKFMKEADNYYRSGNFQSQPPTVKVRKICSYSGLLPTEICSTVNEFFIAGTEPKDVCSGQHTGMVSLLELIKAEKAKEQAEKAGPDAKTDSIIAPAPESAPGDSSGEKTDIKEEPAVEKPEKVEKAIEAPEIPAVPEISEEKTE